VICSPNSATRLATSCREISTLSSAMAFDIKPSPVKLGWQIIEKQALLTQCRVRMARS
jgi:hypothetical protein